MAKRFRHTVSREPIEFEMGGEDYTAIPVLASEVLGELFDLQNDLQGINPAAAQTETLAKVRTILGTIFDRVCEPESAKRIQERLGSRSQPFDLAREVMPTIQSLIEEYTGRPLPPSPSSSTSSDGGGTSSTDGAPPTESTPYVLTPAGS